ncbi:MAG TPA: helix-turn-helix domain-containing protein [Candidatus Aquilonibacter sp.]|nr:helix-turn-helix domain-containing protein [Candidatus Aquilonibacter sp.]
MTSEDTVSIIARRVAEFRKRRHFSLDQLAERAGVSKGALSGLEKGNGNPSIALLCQTAAALRVSVADLLDESPSHTVEQFELDGGKSLWKGPHGGTARLVFGTRGPLMVELWEWQMFPSERYEAKAHSLGTREILWPLEGRLGAEVNGSSLEAKKGQGLFLETDVPHAYYCVGVKTVRFQMIVVEPTEISPRQSRK